MMDFLTEARARGFIHQTTDEAAFAKRMTTGVLPGYIGFDCTADSLHVGSLVQIMLLRLLQRTGHKPVVLMGGGTTKVGDPSFRDEARPLLDDARIETNKAGIRQVFESFLTFGDGPTDAVMLDNAEWLDRLEYIPFLRDVGRHFSVNRMLSMDSVKLRLDREQNLSFLEFNYMLLQSYDFLELFRQHGVALQMGGSDQWGNIVLGADLIRRVTGGEAHVLTTPLITSASGAKMGKTAEGAVWLSAAKKSPFDYWQFWRNTEDGDVGRFLKLFTELPLADLARLEGLAGAGINEAKKVLATEVTAMLHGRAAAEGAAETARRLFEEGQAGGDLPRVMVGGEISLTALLVQAGFAASNAEARRHVAGGGVRLDDVVVTDASVLVQAPAKLSFGRKRHVSVMAGQ